MLKCYEVCSLIPELHEAGATGGVATTLALWLLNKHKVDGVLTSKRYETFIAKDLEGLLSSCGSIYEYFPYTHHTDGTRLAQIGKPCDIRDYYSPRISIFCSRLYGKMSSPIEKGELFALSSLKRFNRALVNQPSKCWTCGDHVGSRADIALGDSFKDRKLNYALVHTELGRETIVGAINDSYINAHEVPVSELKEKQFYLFKGMLSSIATHIWRKIF